MHKRIRVSFALSFGQRAHDRQIEPILLQRRDQMTRQRGIAGIVGFHDLLLVRQPSEDRLAIIDADGWHVVVVEQFLLVVAHYDQRIQLCSRHVVAQPRHCRHCLAVSSRQVLGRNPRQRVRRRARKQIGVIARVAVEIDELSRLVAGQEAPLPIVDA